MPGFYRHRRAPGGNTQKLKDQKEDPGSHPEKEGHDQQEKPVIGYKKKMAEKLIENASFMSITLDELKEDIKVYGVKETYVNGKDQFGFKESIESKTYNAMVKNYMNIMKQLNDMLPEEKKIDIDDEFERFNGGI